MSNLGVVNFRCTVYILYSIKRKQLRSLCCYWIAVCGYIISVWCYRVSPMLRLHVLTCIQYVLQSLHFSATDFPFDALLILFVLLLYFHMLWLWIRTRIRIGSGFNDHVDPHPDSESRCRIRIQGQGNEVKTTLYSTFFSIFLKQKRLLWIRIRFRIGSGYNESMTFEILIRIELKDWIRLRIESIMIHNPGCYSTESSYKQHRQLVSRVQMFLLNFFGICYMKISILCVWPTWSRNQWQSNTG
jgi:hypothetical protein